MKACWYVDGNDMQSLHAARASAIRYLRDQGERYADYDACALALSELLSNAVRHGPGGSIAVSLDWTNVLPRLSVSDAGAGFTLRISLPPGNSEGGRGLFLIAQLIGTPSVTSGASGCTVSVVLPVRRRTDEYEIKNSA